MSHYLPLHIHTDFSNGDALLGVDEYVAWAKSNNYPSIAVTDHGNLCASLYFNQVASKAGIKSVIGLEAYCAFKKEFESEVKEEKRERDHCLLVAKNYQGYLDLCWLLGQAMRNTFYYKPIILYEELFKYNKNLIVSTACMGGRVPKLVLENKQEEAIEFINQMKSTFGNDFYIEVMEIQMPEQSAFNRWVINNYKRLGVKVIWTTDTHYLKPEHAEAHDVLKLINTKGSFKDEGWQKKVYKSRNLWLKKREDIVEEAKSLGWDENLVNEFLDNTLEIDSKIEKVKLTRAPEVIMPKFADNSYEILEKRAYDALKAKGWDIRPDYVARVKSELEVIKFKKMEDYFLIVADIVKFAEDNDVLCGAGRGSGAASLVVYLLGITKIDPIKYGLYFERFLNEKRLDPPDIDLDFDSKGRWKIEEYLKNKYGHHAVSHVISFGTFGIKNAIRDTFRVYFGMEKKDITDVLSKCLENDDDDFDKALEKMIALEGENAKKFIEDHKKQFDIARVLVGKCRHYSMHAGGVIIAPDYLEKYIPIMKIGDAISTGYPEGGDTRLMTDAGLMKFDILGLNACTIINDALRQLKDKITLVNIIDDDNNLLVLKQFELGNTFSIFQFEGKNITKFIKRVKPTKFSDLVAVNALYRPAVIQAGGLEMYLKNKQTFNDKEADKDPFLRILKETYGIIAYQENTMQVFRELGGFTLAEADETRHVFKLLFKGKTDYTDFNHVMSKFKKGCHETTNYDDKKIEEIMELMKQFSKYCFNKCISGDSKIYVFKKLKCNKENQPNACRHVICSTTISDLYVNKNKYSGIAIYDNIKKVSVKAPIKEVVKTGLKETYIIYVKSDGKKRILHATLDHKFFTPSGWRELRNLKEGDEVLIKRGVSVNVGINNPYHHSKRDVVNKGKTGTHFHQPRKLLLPLEYSNKKRSEAALRRTKHGRTGIPFTKESLEKLRQSTIKRFSEGKFPKTNTKIHKKVFAYVSTLERFNFVNEYPISIGCIDIAVPDLKIAIEVQGSFFHSDPRFFSDKTKLKPIQRKNRRYDFLKRRWYKENGWTLLQLWEHDINNDFELCKQKILNVLSDHQPNPWVYEKILLIQKYGLEETYDIHVDHPYHNYIANFFVVHNSHACAYAMMAYIMMYLRTYYPAQYFSSLLSNTENSEAMQDGKKVNLFQNYVTEIQKDFGIKIIKPDVNESGSDVFRIKDDKTLLYALGHIKDVGLKAALNIQENQPYTSFKDFLSRVTRRIVNKRVLKALVYSEAVKFSDTAEVFKKETGEEIDTSNFLQRQLEYTSLVSSKDLKEAIDKEYSLKGVEKAVAEGKTLSKEQAIPIVVFVSKFRRLAGNSKKTGRPYIMYFATLYDGTTRIDDCILNGAEELKIEEGDLVKGMLHFEEARNKKYSDHTFYLSKIEKIKTTENYDALSKFNVQATERKIEEPKMIQRRKRVEEPIKMISRKKINVINEPINSLGIMISRKKKTL
jgi:DNA-directed DNA polymerase III PolC